MLPAGCYLCLPSSWEHTTILLLAVISMVGRCDGDRLLDGVLQRKLQIRRRQHIALFQQEQQLLSRLHHGLKQLETVTHRQVELSASGQLVRLSGGAGPWEGMVEVYYRTQWRRVKANRWTEHETRVVCRQLGYVSLFSKFPSTMQTKSRRSRGSGDTLDIDKCIGDERSLLHCSRARVSNEREVGVACYTADDLSSRCGQGEVPFGDRCYYFGRERVTRLKAGIRCQQRGSVLVRVTSQMKNDFLSGVMLWRGISGLHTSGYGESLDENTRLWFWRNSTKQFLFNNWSPVTAPSEDVEGPFQPRCITLRLSTLEDGSKYALWESSACSDRMDYVCESHQSWRECISGNGASYSGNISTTESDQVCLPWSTVSRYPGLSSPTLKENYCRNPDRDERPWCFTSSDQFEYCDISICPPFLPQPQTKARVACDRDSFRCGASDCVPAGYVCDGDQDCSTNRDEAICDALTYSFQAFPNNDLRVQGDFEGLTRYTSRTLRNCQYMCLVDDACRLFVYFEDESMCITTSTPLGRAWPTRMSGHTVYAVLGRYTPCPGYRCANFQCLNVTAARCDGVTDCDDLSDEKDCSADYGFALRLRGGSGPGSGRLEARIRGRWGSVCDDLFDVDAAYVACRELGFRRPQQFYLNSRKYAEGSGEELLDYTLNGMLCLGNETSLSQCTLLQKPGLCVRGESVALECTNSASLCSSTVNSYQCRDGSGCVTQPFMCSGQNSCDDGSDESADVCEEPQYRLEPGETPRYLSIKPAGRFFRNVTAYNFGEAASNYVCGRLGLGKYGVAFQGAEVPDSRQMSVISCSDDITQCQVSSENHLLPRASVRLHCRRERPPAPQLRLVGGQDTTSGLVEIKPPLGEWGRLCALAFTYAQAKVICGELGHRGTADYTVQPRDPANRASLLALDCLGGENTIADCIHTVWMNQTGDKACNGSGEVLVRCGQPVRRQPLESLQVSVACGHGKPDLSRILGGSATDIPQHGWFAHLDVRKLGERKLKCGATVISKRFVLTAAHCLYRTDVGVNPTGAGPLVSRQLFEQSELFVVVGDSGAEVIDPSQRQIAVARTFRHPGHRAINLYHNDIALLELAEPLVFSDSVQPACLPPADVLYAPQMQCQVTGLGKLSPGLFGALPDRLQVGNVSFFTRQQCQTFYGRSNITAGMVCAGDDRFLVDTCDGDSGGPLTCDLAGVTVVMGVTSWGHGCGRSDYPGVYTRVANYVHWIHDVISHS